MYFLVKMTRKKSTPHAHDDKITSLTT